jgi:hypothetical protein
MPKRGLAKSSFYKKIFLKNYDLISATYHEAGHAVSGLLNFIKIIAVEAKEYKDGKTGGWVCFDNCSAQKNSDADFVNFIILAEVKLNYAGIVAEKLLLKKISGSNISPFFLKWGAKDDVSAAAKLINDYQLAPPGKKRSSFKKKMMKESANELDLHWDAVIAVAHFLYKNKEMSYDDLKKVLSKHTSNKKFWKDQFKKIDQIFDNKLNLDENMIKSIILG